MHDEPIFITTSGMSSPAYAHDSQRNVSAVKNNPFNAKSTISGRYVSVKLQPGWIVTNSHPSSPPAHPPPSTLGIMQLSAELSEGERERTEGGAHASGMERCSGRMGKGGDERTHNRRETEEGWERRPAFPAQSSLLFHQGRLQGRPNHIFWSVIGRHSGTGP